ncbi:MAG: aminotransferase class I/II-fold pyridoxal phosphate-dependent enzyme [Sphaerochaetaceae bacterium]|nr:aminotransferase class I/II-fold pyridoxal phosphate-dependent enzyme [Sphaerochaetaceae bacterium]
MINRVERKGTGCEKYDPQNLINLCGNPNAEPFWVADMDLECPKAVQQALLDIVNHKAYGYQYFPQLPQAFINFAKKRHNLDLTPDDIVVSPGVLASVSAATQLYAGYDIIIPFPAYKPFVGIANNLGRKIHPWKLSYNKDSAHYTMDFDALLAIANQPGQKLLCFCSPHNPSGRVWNAQELDTLLTICKDYNIPILSDEIHADLAFKGQKHIPLVTLAAQYNVQVITFMAPSKTFNVAGNHLSITIFSDKETKQRFQDFLRNNHNDESDLFSGAAAVACYSDSYTWLMELLDMLEENANYIDTYFKTQLPQLRFVKPQASFIGFIDCSAIVDKLPQGMDLAHFFGQKASVAMNDGPWFGQGYSAFVRFNYATDLQHIKAALQRIKEAVNSL